MKELLCYFYAVHQATGLAHVLEIIDGEQLHSGSGLCKRQRCGGVHEKRLGLGSADLAQHEALDAENSAADQPGSPEDQTGASTGSAQNWWYGDWSWWSPSGTWSGCSWKGKASQPSATIVRLPAHLPRGDNRFALRKKDRVYVCDMCDTRVGFVKKSFPFDGQYVDVLAVRNRHVEELKQAYWRGEVNATWRCSGCHQRPDEHINETRVRIECVEVDRVVRTQRIFAQGFRFGPR